MNIAVSTIFSTSSYICATILESEGGAISQSVLVVYSAPLTDKLDDILIDLIPLYCSLPL